MIEAMQIALMFTYACFSFESILRDYKLTGEFVTGDKIYEEVLLSQE